MTAEVCAEEIDPKIMGWMWQAVAARDIVEASSPPAPANDNQTDGIKIIDPSDWEGQPIPERQWYLEGLIPNRQVTLLSGDGGTGKSLLAYQIGLAGVLGVETIEYRPAQGRVVYLAAEDDEGELKRRGHDILTAMGRTFADLKGACGSFLWPGRTPNWSPKNAGVGSLSLQL
ncbi:AAA family ATPase [Bradyrhizobium sp. RDM12]